MNEIFYMSLWACTILLVISGLDDIFIDSLYWFYRHKHRQSLPNIKHIKDFPTEHSVALIICAWKESTVIGRTIRHALKTINYSNYKIFVGLYPNDLKTRKVVEKIAKEDNRVIVCVNNKNGPTTKSDNLNSVYETIKKYELDRNEQSFSKNKQDYSFDIVLIHDSEDFIHKLSLKLYNYLLMHDGFDAVQIPVVPIKDQRGKLIHRTYCDAFAEMHSKDLVVRQIFNVFIPFAGTGMAFRRNVFNILEQKYTQIFNEVNLTEDYELGLRLFKLGYKTSFINLLAHPQRNSQTKVATKEYFPNSFWGAVRQRSRWIAGICFQNWQMHKWEGDLKTKYFLMRDRKVIFSNFVLLLSTLVFFLFVWLFLRAVISNIDFFSTLEHHTVLYIFLWACLLIMIWRLLHRFFFTYHWYGYNYALRSLLRVNVENAINFFATLRAIKIFISMKDEVIWESTDHY